MKIGFTYDEKSLAYISYEELFHQLFMKKVTTVEFSPDKDILSEEKSLDIIRFAAKLGFNINYHVPYFASDDYSISSFLNSKGASRKKFDDFFSFIDNVEDFKNDSHFVIVVHGQHFDSRKEKSLEGTIDFSKYMIEEIRSRNLRCSVSLETLRASSTTKVGEFRSDLIKICKEIDDDAFGICLDICHDVMNYFPYNSTIAGDVPDSEFFKHVNHAHIHGYSLSTHSAHTSLAKSPVNFLSKVIQLEKIKPDITLNLELLSGIESGLNYLDDLYSDIHLINKFVKPI